jgi:hypothetical protein
MLKIPHHGKLLLSMFKDTLVSDLTPYQQLYPPFFFSVTSILSTVSAPGKILVAGGYLVLERPNIGITLAATSRFYATVCEQVSLPVCLSICLSGGFAKGLLIIFLLIDLLFAKHHHLVRSTIAYARIC